MKNICFIGLGVMGQAMAGHLVKAGFSVRGFNRSLNKLNQWGLQYPKAYCAQTLNDAIYRSEVIISCVGNDDDLRSIAYGENGILAQASPDTVWVDHTTTSYTVVNEIARACDKRAMHFIDAPVSGGQSGAENGTLALMIGGEESVLKAINSILECYSSQITHIGASGSGQLTKMVNQICLSGLIQSLAEGLQFAKKAGLDTTKVLTAISKGAAQSWQMENRGETMCADAFNFGFAVEWMRKDLNICLEQAQKINASLPVTALVDQFYADIEAQGGSRWDTSSLIKRLK